MQITPEIIEQMLRGGQSLAQWAQRLGLTEASLSAELFRLSEVAKKGGDAAKAARIVRALQTIERVRTVATAASAAPAVLSLGVRLLIGTSLVVGVVLLVYMGYRVFFSQADKPPPAVAGPTGLDAKQTKGGHHGSGPLTGTVDTEPPSARPAGRDRGEEIRKSAKRTLIDLPEGVGEDEVIAASGLTAVSGGAVSPEYQAAVQQWQKRIDAGIEDLYHQGAFDGFGYTWSNVLKWKPYPAVVKAELRQDGRTVTGTLWFNVGDDPKGFKTRRVAVSRGVVAGARGFEELQIEVADGRLRGTLYLLDRGARIEGEINGCHVALWGRRVLDARKALEAKFPRPTPPAPGRRR